MTGLRRAGRRGGVDAAAGGLDARRRRPRRLRSGGHAAQRLGDGPFRALITAPGGNPSAPLPVGAHTETVVARPGRHNGDVDGMAVGLAAWRLGAGRSRRRVRIHRRPGKPVTAAEPVFTLYNDTPQRFPAAMAALDGGRSIGEPPGERPLIIRVLYYHQVANEPEMSTIRTF